MSISESLLVDMINYNIFVSVGNKVFLSVHWNSHGYGLCTFVSQFVSLPLQI